MPGKSWWWGFGIGAVVGIWVFPMVRPKLPFKIPG